MLPLTQIAFRTVGIPYLWGGQNPLEGLDCSGFARYLLRSVGELPFEDLTAQGIADYLRGHGKVLNSPVEGAFAFFGKSDRQINHVGYCVSQYLMIEAFGDASVTSRERAIAFRDKEGGIVRMYPISRRLDLVACLRPIYRSMGE